MIYEIVENRNDAALEAGGLFLKELTPAPAELETLKAAASCWKVVGRVEYEKTLYWHNDDTESGSYRVEHEPSWVVKNGVLFGFLLSFRNQHGMGLSHHYEDQRLLLALDGRVFGKNRHTVDRSSSETDLSEVGVFSLEKRKKS